jgi:hypothetical protein
VCKILAALAITVPRIPDLALPMLKETGKEKNTFHLSITKL